MLDPWEQCDWPVVAPRYATALREAVAFALAEVDAIGIVAAGTIVRGTPHASSDLDVYVLHAKPFRRRVQRYFGDGVPAELFINPPAAVRAYFAEEHESGRPITAHMLASGHVILARGDELADLRREAEAWLARPSHPDATALVRMRYDAATRFEDAIDMVDEDPAVSALLLTRAVIAMLELWCRARSGTIPRGKDLLATVGALDSALSTLARRVFSDVPFPERVAAAGAIADIVLETRGFFEWDSGPEPVPVWQA